MKCGSILLALLLTAGAAMGDTIVVVDIVPTSPTTFELWADASGTVPGYQGDANGGIAGLVLNLDSFTSFCLLKLSLMLNQMKSSFLLKME